MSIRISAKPVNITIIQVYALTSTADDREIEDIYCILQQCIDNIRARDMWFIMGSFNAKVGSTKEYVEKRFIGSFGLGERNERSDRLVEFVSQNCLVIVNTFLKQHPRRLFTWTFPDENYENQIDYILAPKRWRTSVAGVKTLPGADCGTDHELLSAKVNIKLEKGNVLMRYDMTAINDEYKIDVQNVLLN